MLKKLFMLCAVVLAVALAVPSTRAQIQARAIKPVTDAIGARLVPRRLEAMGDQLDVRLSRAEGLPVQGFEAWLRMYYTGPDLDPWDRPWFIQAGRRQYTVGSMGPDGQLGTEDDITESRDLVQRPR